MQKEYRVCIDDWVGYADSIEDAAKKASKDTVGRVSVFETGLVETAENADEYNEN